MDTWNRLTAVGEAGAGGLEEISKKTYVHVCRTHVHRQQQRGEGLGGGGGRLSGERQRRVNGGASVIVSTIKIIKMHFETTQKSPTLKKRSILLYH